MKIDENEALGLHLDLMENSEIGDIKIARKARCRKRAQALGRLRILGNIENTSILVPGHKECESRVAEMETSDWPV
jgi:hypothetical protein